MRLVFLGLPGAGKGTQAKMVSEKFRIPSFSTGNAFRELNDERIKGYLAKGVLVPDKIVFEFVKNFIDRKDAFILDGFPRNLKQAELLDDFLKKENRRLDCVINIVVDEEEAIGRLTNRLYCVNCDIIYNRKTNPPKNDNKCDICNGELVIREDDNVDTIKNRINIYWKEMEDVINYYKMKNVLVEIKGKGEPKDVFERIKNILNGK